MVVAYTFSPHTQGAEAVDLLSLRPVLSTEWFPGQPWLHRKEKKGKEKKGNWGEKFFLLWWCLPLNPSIQEAGGCLLYIASPGHQRLYGDPIINEDSENIHKPRTMKHYKSMFAYIFYLILRIISVCLFYKFCLILRIISCMITSFYS